MSNIVNLRQFRKRRKREENAHNADNNRQIFGTPSKLRKQAKSENAIRSKRLDGKHLVSDD